VANARHREADGAGHGQSRRPPDVGGHCRGWKRSSTIRAFTPGGNTWSVFKNSMIASRSSSARASNAAREASAATLDGFLSRVHPDDRDTLQTVLEQARASDQSLNLTFRILRDGGEVSWVETHARAYSATANAPERVVGVLQDISEPFKIWLEW